MEESDRLRDLLLTLVRYLVDGPDAVQVRVTTHDASVLCELKVGPDDIGRVIGRHGRVIHALRVVLRSVAAQAGRRVELELVE